VSIYTTMAYGVVTCYGNCHGMELSGQLHVATALPPEKELPLSGSQSRFCRFWRSKKSRALQANRTRISRLLSASGVTVPTALFELNLT
jgi:hypothetical protein